MGETIFSAHKNSLMSLILKKPCDLWVCNKGWVIPSSVWSLSCGLGIWPVFCTGFFLCVWWKLCSQGSLCLAVACQRLQFRCSVHRGFQFSLSPSVWLEIASRFRNYQMRCTQTVISLGSQIKAENQGFSLC